MNYYFFQPITSYESSRSCSRSSTPCSAISSQSKQSKMKRFVDNVTPADSDKIDMLLAEFFFGCNVPFSACDSKYFKKLINALRPAYSPPNRKKLAGALLNKVHSTIEVKNNDLVKNMNNEAILLIDGWTNSNSNRHNIVTMLATAQDHKIFLESYDISEGRETSANITEIVQKAVALAKEKFDIDVYAVVSDNAPNMTCMGRAIQPDLMYTTCNSHTGNLLAKDVIAIKKYEALMAKVMKVQKEFKKPGLESRLKTAGGKKPVLYSVIRFASTRNAIKSFLENLSFMKQVSANDENIESDTTNPDTAITQLLFNATFVESVKNLLSILDPIAKLINSSQKSDFSAADAIEEWFELFENAPREITSIVEARCKKSDVFNNVTMTANFFHPVYRGRKLNESQQQQVNDYIFDSLESDALESCRLFEKEEGIFASLKRKKITSPHTFWYYAAQKNHKELSAFATKLLKIPASTAQLERLFSNWSYVHNEIRNRLSTETSKKLLEIYFSFRSQDIIDDDSDDDNDNEMI